MSSAYASPNTPPQLVKPGDTYSINEGWEATKTTPNPAAASTSTDNESLPIRFTNSRRASAMVFKRVRNRIAPTFILSLGAWPLERGRYEIVPSGTLILFFSAAEPSTTFELDQIPMAYYELDYTKSPQVDVIYTADGDWKVKTTASDGYTVVSDSVYTRDWSKNTGAKL